MKAKHWINLHRILLGLPGQDVDLLMETCHELKVELDTSLSPQVLAEHCLNRWLYDGMMGGDET